MLANFKIPLKGGKEYEIEFNKKSDELNKTFFILGVHKSGSTLMNRILSEIFEEINVAQISIDEVLFSSGIPLNSVDTNKLLLKEGICYRGFRTPWIVDKIKNMNARSILLVRDPRDALISYFFSEKYSHSIPEGEVGVSLMKRRANLMKIEKPSQAKEWIMKRAEHIKTSLNKYIDGIVGSDHKIYRYEDIIFYKLEWVIDMLNYLELDVPESVIKSIVDKHDIVPDKEQKKSHIRSVVPGNHRKYFDGDILGELNNLFSDELALLGYKSVPHINLNQ